VRHRAPRPSPDAPASIPAHPPRLGARDRADRVGCCKPGLMQRSGTPTRTPDPPGGDMAEPLADERRPARIAQIGRPDRQLARRIIGRRVGEIELVTRHHPRGCPAREDMCGRVREFGGCRKRGGRDLFGQQSRLGINQFIATSWHNIREANDNPSVTTFNSSSDIFNLPLCTISDLSL